MQGITFGNEGPIMHGTWYNPTTGDAFTVRDSFFEDNEYVVTTTDGRYLKYNQLQNYIQSDMKLEDLKKMKQEKAAKAAKDEPIPAEIANLLETEDPYASYMIPEDNVLSKPLGNIYETTPARTVATYTEAPAPKISTASMNEAIIEKALKNTAKPDFTVNVIWENYPKKQIEMLKDIMDISEEEIIDWYLDNIQISDVVEAIKVSIMNKILNKVEDPVDQLTQEASDIIPIPTSFDPLITLEADAEKPKKKPRKTTKA